MSEEDIREAVLGYLAAHSDATGTLEGITQWCAAHHRVGDDRESVRRAVQQLTEAGFLEETGRGAGRRYRLTGRERVGLRRKLGE